MTVGGQSLSIFWCSGYKRIFFEQWKGPQGLRTGIIITKNGTILQKGQKITTISFQFAKGSQKKCQKINRVLEQTSTLLRCICHHHQCVLAIDGQGREGLLSKVGGGGGEGGEGVGACIVFKNRLYLPGLWKRLPFSAVPKILADGSPGLTV
jgi:hypothetical protein